ncbi:MAG: GTP-binding protein [Deltaproteobacteria bacterium]|nr:GTP-binding protein [Deltaproteobacteria bacterium]
MIVDIVFGFFGSGKTTFIIRALEKWGAKEKIVVLVNEFGDVGIDGDLLTGQGGDVVEMPSGCICCTLQADFRSQMLEISQTIKPDRVIVEPTGVATIAQVRSIVEAQLFEHVIEKINNILIADATGFMGLYKANRHFVESQVRNTQLALLNKCDRVNKRKAMVTQGALSSINPEMTVLMTEFGAVDWAEYQFALATAPRSKEDVWKEENHLAQITAGNGESHPHHDEEGELHVHFHEEEDALGYESFGCVYHDQSFDQGALEKLFQQLKTSNSGMGEIVRAKGIFRIADGWMLMELASAEFSSQPLKQSTDTKVSIIGKGLDRELIGSALAGCMSEENVIKTT